MKMCPHTEKMLAPNGCPVSERAMSFDPFGADYQADPALALKWARDQEPVFYSTELGYWIVTKYDDVKAVFRDNILFSPSVALEKITPAGNEAQAILSRYGFNMQRTMVNEDEPDHMERRRLLLDDFLPANLEKHEATVRSLTRKYMDRFVDRGHADLVADIFYDIPLTVALHFLGVSDDEADELKAFAVAHTLNTWGRPSPQQQLEIAEKVGRFWQRANRIIDRMIERPDGEGWMYETVRQHFKHPKIVPESYLRSMMMAILAAAHETTSNATVNAFRLLLENRDAWEDVCRNPNIIPNAVEECLRLAGSIVAWRRITTADAIVGGVNIPKGERLLLVQASANVDRDHWENAEQFDIYRDNSTDHMTFGYGAHQCMGKNIGRMEMRVFLDEFSRRLPHIELVKGQNFENLPNVSFHGPKKLMVQWDPDKNPERSDPSIRFGQNSFRIGPPAREQALRPMQVRETERLTDDVLRVVLEDPRKRPLPRYSPGAHIELVHGEFRRKYSLCGNPDNLDTYQIAIHADKNGRGGSMHFTQSLREGVEVRVVGPRNHFQLSEVAEDYLLIAGGIGITPIVSMADRLKALGKSYHLYFCAGRRVSAPLIDAVLDRHAASTSLHFTDEGSRLNLHEELSDLNLHTQVYACGPDRLLGELQSMSVNWPAGAALHFEYFNSAAGAGAPSDGHAFEVELKDSGLTLMVAKNQTLHEAISSAGIDLPIDCGEGLCGTCECRVIDGDVDHRDRVLSDAERQSGTRMMTCCSRAHDKRLVLAL